jgi:multiple sugar transport system permease protein
MGKVLTYALLAVWSLVCVFPLYWVAVTSLKSETAITEGPSYIPFVDFTPALGAWAFVLADANDNLLPRYFNSAFVGLASTLFALFLGGMAVYGLTWFTKAARHNYGILLAILATRILPPVVIVLPIYMMAQFAGLLDTRLALIFTYTALNLPVAVWLLQPIFGARATAQEEAAQLDGASQFQIFFTIFLPMVAASIAAVGLLIFILCWNEYLFAAYLAGNHAMTLPPWLVGQMSVKEAQIGSEAEEWAHLSAATILMAAPLLTCTVFVQRFLGRMTLWSR